MTKKETEQILEFVYYVKERDRCKPEQAVQRLYKDYAEYREYLVKLFKEQISIKNSDNYLQKPKVIEYLTEIVQIYENQKV